MVRFVPGIAHSLATSLANRFSFSPGASGPFTSSLIAPYRNSAIISRIVSSMMSSLDCRREHPRDAPWARHETTPR